MDILGKYSKLMTKIHIIHAKMNNFPYAVIANMHSMHGNPSLHSTRPCLISGSPRWLSPSRDDGN